MKAQFIIVAIFLYLSFIYFLFLKGRVCINFSYCLHIQNIQTGPLLCGSVPAAGHAHCLQLWLPVNPVSTVTFFLCATASIVAAQDSVSHSPSLSHKITCALLSARNVRSQPKHQTVRQTVCWWFGYRFVATSML